MNKEKIDINKKIKVKEERFSKIKSEVDCLNFLVCASVAKTFEDLADMRRAIDRIRLELAKLIME